MNERTRIVRIGGMAAMLLSLWAGVVAARAPDRGPAVPDGPAVSTEPTVPYHPALARTDKLIGAKVVDARGKWLGTIEEIVLTPSREAIDYAVFAYGGVWGVAERRFAVPWSQLQVRPATTDFVLSVDRKVLDRANGLGEDYWPTTATEDWTRVALQPATDIQHRRLSKLAGLTVRNEQGQTLGQLESFVVDVARGGLAYAILWVPRDLPDLMARDLVAVPWAALEILPSSGTVRLNAAPQTLETLAFHARDFPDLEDAQYSRRLHDRFNATPYWQALGYVPAEPQPRTP